jgi:hypothetical protein
MPNFWSSNSFYGIDILMCHYFKKEIKDLTIGVMDQNKGNDYRKLCVLRKLDFFGYF